MFFSYSALLTRLSFGFQNGFLEIFHTVIPAVPTQRKVIAKASERLVHDSGKGTQQLHSPAKTSDMVNLIAHANGKGILLIRGFGWAIKLLRPVTGIVDKAFGSLCYDFELSRYSRDYCVKNFQESILETEG